MTNLSSGKFGLDADSLERVQSVFNNFPEVTQVIIYGSRAKGVEKLGSDIDLALKGEDISLNTLLAIENDLDDLLLPYKFDISIYKNINNIELIRHIQKFGQVFSNFH